MGVFSRTAVALNAAAVIDRHDILPPAPVAGNTIGLEQIPGLIGGWMSRDNARLVPAFARGEDLITGVAAGLPLVETDPSGAEIQPLGFTARPSYEKGVPVTVTMRKTVSDMVCEGRAYWVITEALVGGYPQEFQRVDPVDVTKNQDGSFIVAGNHVPASRMVEFDSGTPGALNSGWFALRTAVELEAAASRYALSPLPQIALRSTGVDLFDEQIEELLSAWEAARRTRGTAYLNSGVETETFGWNSAELQLVEARQHSALEVSRMLNIDAVWLGATIPGSSLTYQNRQDLNQSLLDTTVMPLLRPIEQRLSMLTVGRYFRFDAMAFLRANLNERVTALTQYVAAGILTVDEARDLEPLVKEGGLPS